MFTKKETWLDKEIARTDRSLRSSTVGSEDYAKLFQFRLQLQELKNGNSKPVSKETLVLAATNLIGIVLIIKHEHVNVISSKAMSLLMKAR